MLRVDRIGGKIGIVRLALKGRQARQAAGRLDQTLRVVGTGVKNARVAIAAEVVAFDVGFAVRVFEQRKAGRGIAAANVEAQGFLGRRRPFVAVLDPGADAQAGERLYEGLHRRRVHRAAIAARPAVAAQFEGDAVQREGVDIAHRQQAPIQPVVFRGRRVVAVQFQYVNGAFPLAARVDLAKGRGTAQIHGALRVGIRQADASLESLIA